MTYFVKLDNIWVSNDLKNMNLSCHTFDIRLILDFILLQNLDGDFLSGNKMRAEAHFAKGALSKWAAYRKKLAQGKYKIEYISLNYAPNIQPLLFSWPNSIASHHFSLTSFIDTVSADLIE